MLSLRFLSLAAAAFIAASTMAQAAPGSYHAMPAHRLGLQPSGATLPPRTEPYAASELWPSCRQGPPACTAAGYPNLNYQREIGNMR